MKHAPFCPNGQGTCRKTGKGGTDKMLILEQGTKKYNKENGSEENSKKEQGARA